jgi:hypothetical protein
VCASAGGLKPHLVRSLRAARKAGSVITLGPRRPDLDGAMRPLHEPTDIDGLEIESLEDLARADLLVSRRIDELALPTWPVDPLDAHATVHEDESGGARVVFVMNPTAGDLAVRLSLPGVDALVDATGEGRMARAGAAIEVTVPARVVRMLAVDAVQ